LQARDALAARATIETDDQVQQEIAAALERVS